MEANTPGEIVAKYNEATAAYCAAREDFERLTRDYDVEAFRELYKKDRDAALSQSREHDAECARACRRRDHLELVDAYWREVFATRLLADASRVYFKTVPAFIGKAAGEKTREKLLNTCADKLAALGYAEKRWRRSDGSFNGESFAGAPLVHFNGASRLKVRAEGVEVCLWAPIDSDFIDKSNKITAATPRDVAPLPLDRFASAEDFAAAFTQAREKLATLRKEFEKNAKALADSVAFGYISLASVGVHEYAPDCLKR